MSESILKGDIIKSAFSRARISGLTKQPSPEDLELALDRLEDMAAAWKEKNLCCGYYFEDTPDPNTPSNVPRKYQAAFKSSLAIRILADFGKQAMPSLQAEANGELSSLYAATANTQPIPYPSRMPRGSGTTLRWDRWRKFFPVAIAQDISCAIQKLTVGEITTLTEHFDSYLRQDEVIDSFTLEETSGLGVSLSASTDTDITYTVEAEAVDSYTSSFSAEIVFTVTTSLGRVEKRLKKFEIYLEEPNA